MIKLRDHYFIAWLKVIKKYIITFNEYGIFVDMNSEEYSQALKEYKESFKPLFKEIRKIVKELAQYTSKSKVQ
jgi:DNA-binding cell septation regulator SpoVG